MDVTHAAVETIARESYGRLVAYLAARSGDVAGSEDALSDAFLSALQRWPGEGLPQKPEAWLLTAARRRLTDVARHQEVHSRSVEMLQLASEATLDNDELFPDERLKLLFVCAHPAINAGTRTPLMLQTVLGLDAARIASAFLTSPTAMGQRLVRAKTKIRDAGIPFSVPTKVELPERLQSVLEAIYAAYTYGWEDGEDLAHEAIWLGRVVCQLLPHEPEALGLLALMMYCQARRPARLDATGGYVPLNEQDPQVWSGPMIQEAEECLSRASEWKNMGRFQLEAAIQSVHAQRRFSGTTQWAVIVQLYDGLLHFSPTVGAQIGRAVAVSQVEGAIPGLALLDLVSADLVQDHQPYWAARAHLLNEAGLFPEAKTAYERAIGLSENPTQRAFLQSKSQLVSTASPTRRT